MVLEASHGAADRDSTALSELQALLPQLHELADKTGIPLIRHRVQELASVIRRNLSGTMDDQHAGSRETQDGRAVRFNLWAEQHGYRGATTFLRQGELLRTARPEMIALCQHLAGGGRHSFQPADLAYNMLKILVHRFDPETHGQNFEAYAIPLVTAAFHRCADAQALCLPDVRDRVACDQFVESLASGTDGTSRPTSPLVYRPASHATPRRPAAAKGDEEKSPVGEGSEPARPSKPTTHESTPVVMAHPQVAPSAAPLSAEQTDEHMRQARVQEFVRAQVPGAAHVYDQAGAESRLREHYESVAKTGVHTAVKRSGVSKPKNTAVEKTAAELLGMAIQSFDPGEGGGDRFRGHLMTLIHDRARSTYDSHG